GMFHRGSGLNLTSRQYTASTAGDVPSDSGTLGQGVQHPWERRGLLPPPLPSPLCSNLETASHQESSKDLFTISGTSTLYLQAGQCASVFMDSMAGSPLTVQSGSDFSAVLLG
ncbi:ERFE protein, partial [Sitta europaea]|nr:ERFE protein [Sitta europaea]